MKCPFRNTTIKKGENSINYKTDEYYEDCYEALCMAFDVNNKCRLIESKLIEHKVLEGD